MAGARRWVWNWALARWKEHYTSTGQSIPLKQLFAELTALKKQPTTAWLALVDSQALQQAIKDLHRAFINFFEKRARYPRFKSRKRDKARFRIPQRIKLKAGMVYIPKVGWVRIRQSQEVEGTIKGATFRQTADGHWYVSLTVAFEMPEVAAVLPELSRIIGIDLGLIDFATLSDRSRPIPVPRFHRQGQRKLRKAQRALSRRHKGSKRREKARKHLGRVHQKIARKRSDFLHKLTAKLVNQHAGFCIEDLNLRGLARTKLARSFHDAAMGEFRRQLEYKCLWNCKVCVPIGRFFPSSKRCHVCGAINEDLSLSDRQWVCECGAEHDRDLNAAINIRDEGLRILAAGQAESRNAQGASVRPDTVGLLVSN
jgi:putative transposase